MSEETEKLRKRLAQGYFTYVPYTPGSQPTEASSDVHTLIMVIETQEAFTKLVVAERNLAQGQLEQQQDRVTLLERKNEKLIRELENLKKQAANTRQLFQKKNDEIRRLQSRARAAHPTRRTPNEQVRDAKRRTPR